jgi:hypothetical protein
LLLRRDGKRRERFWRGVLIWEPVKMMLMWRSVVRVVSIPKLGNEEGG